MTILCWNYQKTFIINRLLICMTWLEVDWAIEISVVLNQNTKIIYLNYVKEIYRRLKNIVDNNKE
jgi:hypothetical protein